MDTCVKCGSGLIDVQYVEGGDRKIGACKEQGKRTEFVKYVANTFDYKVISIKEHLSKKCTCCSYLWRENTKDNAYKDEPMPPPLRRVIGLS